MFGVACPRLAPLVEEGNIDTAETRNALRGYIGPLLEKDIDTLVLGCSHYAHLNEHIRRIVGPGIEIVDPAVETVTATANSPANGSRAREVGEYEFIVTGDPACFLAVARRLLGDDLTKVGRVEVSPI